MKDERNEKRCHYEDSTPQFKQTTKKQTMKIDRAANISKMAVFYP
ncbi:MAG TPA: hypothetical protein PL009_12485 [Flavipsychrobacter sp.]|nr:hypothetical protein [Flavipsychrobacter sp.]